MKVGDDRAVTLARPELFPLTRVAFCAALVGVALTEKLEIEVAVVVVDVEAGEGARVDWD